MSEKKITPLDYYVAGFIVTSGFGLLPVKGD